MYDCPRCGTRLAANLSECHVCGMPTTFMEPVRRPPGGGDAVEPEVLDSLDDLRPRGGAPPQVRQVGCTAGPAGCGCLGLPVAVVAGVLLASVAALAWVLRAGQAVSGIATLARSLVRGGRGPRPT